MSILARAKLHENLIFQYTQDILFIVPLLVLFHIGDFIMKSSDTDFCFAKLSHVFLLLFC